MAALFGGIGNHHNIELDEHTLRVVFLNKLRSFRKAYHKDFGEIVICCDGRNSWRKQYFPYYKANRKKSRDESDLDWGVLFEIMDNIRQDIVEFFPYKVIHIENVEADDIIASLCHKYGAQLGDGEEKILIASSDKDFIQLHKYSNVYQIDPKGERKWISHNDPYQYKFEHVLKGDRGDGIPNILSADNSLAVGIRQKPMTAKRIEMFQNDINSMTDDERKNYERNQLMIDLDMIPQEYQDAVIESFETQPDVGRSKLYKYFIKKRLSNLMEDLQDF